jgi:hypothetical protein
LQDPENKRDSLQDPQNAEVMVSLELFSQGGDTSLRPWILSLPDINYTTGCQAFAALLFLCCSLLQQEK